MQRGLIAAGNALCNSFYQLTKCNAGPSRKFIKWPDVEIISHVVAKIPRPKADPKWQKCHYSFPGDRLLSSLGRVRRMAYCCFKKKKKFMLTNPPLWRTTLLMKPYLGHSCCSIYLRQRVCITKRPLSAPAFSAFILYYSSSA